MAFSPASHSQLCGKVNFYDAITLSHAGCLILAVLQFGPGAMQQHGFARNLDWEISTSSADLQPDEKDPSVELTLADNEYTRAMW